MGCQLGFSVRGHPSAMTLLAVLVLPTAQERVLVSGRGLYRPSASLSRGGGGSGEQ